MPLKLPLTLPLRLTQDLTELIEASVDLSPTVTYALGSVIESTINLSSTVTTVSTLKTTVSATLMALPDTIDTFQDIETLSLVGYLMPTITIAETNNPITGTVTITPMVTTIAPAEILSTIDLSTELIIDSTLITEINQTATLSPSIVIATNYTDTSNGTIELTSIISIVQTETVEASLALSDDVITGTDYKVTIETTLNLSNQILDAESDIETLEKELTLTPEVTVKHIESIEAYVEISGLTKIEYKETISSSIDLSSEKQIAWTTSIEPTLALTLAELVSSTFWDIEILSQELYLGVETIDIDHDQELLENTLTLTPSVETKYIELIEETINLRCPNSNTNSLRFPLTFPLEFEYATVVAEWNSFETIEAELGLLIEYEDSVPLYIQGEIDLSYGFTSEPFTVICDIFHKLEITDDEFEQILLETGVEVELIRYGNHVVEDLLGIFQYISFDYTFSTVEDLGPYDAVLFAQDGNEIKRNDIIRYEGEYFSVIYSSIEKIGRNTLYVVYGLKKMTDYGLGINITVT